MPEKRIEVKQTSIPLRKNWPFTAVIPRGRGGRWLKGRWKFPYQMPEKTIEVRKTSIRLRKNWPFTNARPRGRGGRWLKRRWAITWKANLFNKSSLATFTLHQPWYLKLLKKFFHEEGLALVIALVLWLGMDMSRIAIAIATSKQEQNTLNPETWLQSFIKTRLIYRRYIDDIDFADLSAGALFSERGNAKRQQ